MPHPPGPARHHLDVVGGPVRLPRADASRNREHLLATARRLVARGGVDALSMDRLAEEACLGKGTIFRRFGSRSGLFQALLDDLERGFQERYLSGPPPLGPGADPVTRLVAWGHARLDIVVEQGPLLSGASAGAAADLAHPVHAASRLHVRVLLRAADVGGAGGGDVDLLTVQLLAALDPHLVLQLLRTEGLTIARLAAGWEDLVRRVTAPAGP